MGRVFSSTIDRLDAGDAEERKARRAIAAELAKVQVTCIQLGGIARRLEQFAEEHDPNGARPGS